MDKNYPCIKKFFKKCQYVLFSNVFLTLKVHAGCVREKFAKQMLILLVKIYLVQKHTQIYFEIYSLVFFNFIFQKCKN